MAETPTERLARIRARLTEAAAMAAAGGAAPPDQTVDEEEGEPTRPIGRAPAPAREPRFPEPPTDDAPPAPPPPRSAPPPTSAPPPPPPPASPSSPPMWQPTSPAPVSTSPPPWQPAGAPPTERRGRGGIRTAAIVAGVVVISALILIGVGIALGRAFQETGVKYSDLKAGDCFQKPSGRFNKVKTVPCTDQHDLEVYALVDHPAPPKTPFPGTDNLVRYASPLCLAQFKAYAGVAFEQVNLMDVYITPRDSAWKDGVRRLVCAVQPSNQQRTDKSVKAGAK